MDRAEAAKNAINHLEQAEATRLMPFAPPEPTENELLWQLYWAVNSYINTDAEFDRVDEIMVKLTDWLYANSEPSTNPTYE